MVKNSSLYTDVGYIGRCTLCLFTLHGDCGYKKSPEIFQGHVSQWFPKDQAAFVHRQPQGDLVSWADGGQRGRPGGRGISPICRRCWGSHTSVTLQQQGALWEPLVSSFFAFQDCPGCLEGGICTYGLMGPVSDATVLTVSLSVLIWFATDKESLEDVLGSQTATATPRPRGAWHHVLSQPSAAEPAPHQSPRLQPGVVLLLGSSQIAALSTAIIRWPVAVLVSMDISSLCRRLVLSSAKGGEMSGRDVVWSVLG